MNETDSSSSSDPAPLEQAALPADRPPPGPRVQGTTALVLALISLCLSVGFAATAFFIWNEVQQLTGQQSGIGAQIDKHLQPVRTSIEQLADSAGRSTETANRRLQAIEQANEVIVEEQENIDQRVRVLGTLLGRSDEGWNLAEVEYLLGIANKQLQLRGDVKTAKVALQSADARLRELSDPHYLVVREQIAKDLEMLARVPAVDVDGIAITLDSWLERVDSLPVAGTRYQPADMSEAADPERLTTATDWKQVPHLVWELLSEHFRFREHDKPVKPMLAPEREYFLRENLRLQISAAKLALLRDDGDQYRAAIITSLKWLDEYFSTGDAGVDTLAVKLHELSEVDVSPAMPNISGSLRLLRQQIKLANLAQNSSSAPESTVESAMPKALTSPEEEVSNP